MTNFVVSSQFKNQHSGRCPRFCHPKVSNFPSGCSKTTKWVTESTSAEPISTKWATESTNGDPISTKWVPPKIQNGVRQLYDLTLETTVYRLLNKYLGVFRRGRKRRNKYIFVPVNHTYVACPRWYDGVWVILEVVWWDN